MNRYLAQTIDATWRAKEDLAERELTAGVDGFGAANGNYQTSARGRAGVFVALVTRVFAGAGVAWLNWLIKIGQRL